MKKTDLGAFHLRRFLYILICFYINLEDIKLFWREWKEHHEVTIYLTHLFLWLISFTYHHKNIIFRCQIGKAIASPMVSLAWRVLQAATAADKEWRNSLENWEDFIAFCSTVIASHYKPFRQRHPSGLYRQALNFPKAVSSIWLLWMYDVLASTQMITSVSIDKAKIICKDISIYP